jgi:hypothetical protein
VESLLSKKKDPKKRRKKEKVEQGLKSKRGETSYEEAPCFKGRYSIERKKERKKGDHIFL